MTEQNKILKNLIRPDLRDGFKGYISSIHKRDVNDTNLDLNESPFVPYTKENSDENNNRYPQQQDSNLLKRMSQVYDVDKNKITLCAGSSQGIELCVKLFCTPFKDAIIVTTPCYDFIKYTAKIHGIKYKDVVLKSENQFRPDINDFKTAITEATKIIYLCSPNNPLGQSINQGFILDLLAVINQKTILIIDEAYIEYTDKNSCANLIKKHPNIVVLRSLSKAYGAAAIRCGAMISHSIYRNHFQQMLPVAPLSKNTIELAQEVLSEQGISYRQKNIHLIEENRTFLIEELSKIPLIEKIFPSETNYVLVKTNGAEEFIKKCSDKNVMVRDRSHLPELENCVRITVGTKEEISLLIDALNT